MYYPIVFYEITFASILPLCSIIVLFKYDPLWFLWGCILSADAIYIIELIKLNRNIMIPLSTFELINGIIIMSLSNLFLIYYPFHKPKPVQQDAG